MNRTHASCRRASHPGRGALRARDRRRRRPPTSKGEYLARAGDCIACHSVPGGKAFAGGLQHGNADGRDLLDQHHARSGNRHRRLFARGFRSRRALGASPRTGTASIRPCPIRPMPRSPTTTCRRSTTFFMKEVPPVKQANKPNEIPGYLSFALAAGDLEHDVHRERRLCRASRTTTPPGIAALIWSRGWAIAAPATRRAAGRFRKRRSTTAAAPISKARSSTPGRRPICAAICAPALGGWSQDDLAAFLKTGHNSKGVAFGSMLDVVNNSTPYLTDDDIERDGRVPEIAAGERRADGARL